MKKNKTKLSLCAPAVLQRALSVCSPRCLIRLAKWFTWPVVHSNNQLYRRCRENIHLCFPELEKKQQQAMMKQVLWHTNCSFFELAAIWHHSLHRVLANIQSESVDERFYQSKKAKIVIAPHHGSWEMLNLWLSDQGPLYSLYKPARFAATNEYVLQKRARNGAFLAPSTTAGLRHLLKGLKSNATVMILPDQRPASNTAQIEASFMGYPAATSLLIKKLLDKVDCDVFIASMRRNLKAASYHLKLKALDVDTLKKDDLESANYMNLAIEDLIQDDLSQYQWTYRRFPIHYYHALEHDRRHLDESKFE